MFGELVTDAGPIAVGRAEAMLTDELHVYHFKWKNTSAVDPYVVRYVRLYVTREGSSCFGMVPIILRDDNLVKKDHLTLRLRIEIPFMSSRHIDLPESEESGLVSLRLNDGSRVLLRKKTCWDGKSNRINPCSKK